MKLQRLVRIEQIEEADKRSSLIETIKGWVKEEGGVIEEEHHFDGFSARFKTKHLHMIMEQKTPYTCVITIHSEIMIDSFWDIAKKLACLEDGDE